MPGAVPRTSTMALTNATLPYVIEIANMGWKEAMRQHPEIRCGANVVYGNVVDTLGLTYIPIETFL